MVQRKGSHFNRPFFFSTWGGIKKHGRGVVIKKHCERWKTSRTQGLHVSSFVCASAFQVNINSFPPLSSGLWCSCQAAQYASWSGMSRAELQGNIQRQMFVSFKVETAAERGWFVLSRQTSFHRFISSTGMKKNSEPIKIKRGLMAVDLFPVLYQNIALVVFYFCPRKTSWKNMIFLFTEYVS